MLLLLLLRPALMQRARPEAVLLNGRIRIIPLLRGSLPAASLAEAHAARCGAASFPWRSAAASLHA